MRLFPNTYLEVFFLSCLCLLAALVFAADECLEFANFNYSKICWNTTLHETCQHITTQLFTTPQSKNHYAHKI